VGWEAIEQLADVHPYGVDGAFGGFAQQGFELGEDLLDWIEVRAVGRQEQEMCAGLADGPTHGFALVAAEVVHDDDVAGPERGNEALLDPGSEGHAVDRSVEHVGRVYPITSQGGDEGHGAPVAEGRIATHAMAFAAPAMGAHHVGLHPGLIDEDETISRDPTLILPPARPPARDVAPGLFGGQQRFF